MELDRTHGKCAVPESLDSAVVEVAVRNHEVGWQTVWIDGIAVILGGDKGASSHRVLDRMVGAAVTEFELVGAAAGSKCQQLMAEADAEQWDFAVEGSHRGDDRAGRSRIPGAVGHDDAVWSEGENLSPRRTGRQHDDLRVTPYQFGDHAPLVTAVQQGDFSTPVAVALGPGHGRLGHEVGRFVRAGMHC